MRQALQGWRVGLQFLRANPIFTTLLLALVTWLTGSHPAHAAPLLLGSILLDDVNTVTTKTIMPGVVDNFFKAGPVIAYLRTRFTRKWVGPQIQENYMYAPMRGGAYKKGATFNITKRQTRSGMLFTPRYYEVNITEYLEDIEVEMTGPNAVFSIVKTDAAEAALTMSAILEIAIFRNGQNLGAGADRSAEINGLEEALTDGTTATWTGATFPSYGGQTRVDVSPALNSPVGLVAASMGGMSFRGLQHSYLSTCIGAEHPEIGVTTNRGLGYISETFLPHQIVDVVDPEIKWPGLKFNQSRIVVSQYAPGADGVNDPDLGNYLASAGETFWWLNPGPQGDDAYLRLYIAQSAKFAFGFTGFKGARDDNMVAGQILFGGNFTCRAPRLSRGLYAIAK
jgi:hypothetical protein